ncbi:MAG TPA: hypothetical protein VGK48_10035 [Terriglobia bacterium]
MSPHAARVVEGELLWKDEEPKGGQYPAGLMTFWACLVIEAGVSLRGVERILLVLNETFGLRLPIPDWTTGRTWILRLGLWELRRPLPKAGPGVRWGWVADHAVQIGTLKVLLVLGVRLEMLPKTGPWDPLQMQDMQLIGLIPMSPSNAKAVDEALETLIARTGLPDVIVNDLGADLHGGVKRFCERHPETLEIYDAAHKGACLLKARLEKDEHWKKFQSLCGQTRVQVVQTELACVMPPRLRMKSRYMNLDPVLSWAVWAWGLLRESRAGRPPLDITAARMEEKLSWLDEFEEKLPEWLEWLEQIEAMLETVRQQGHSRETPALLKSRMPAASYSSTQLLAEELHAFVSGYSNRVQPFERLPGSSEVLESTQGKLKTLERQQSQEGFTRFVLGIGACLGNALDRMAEAAQAVTNKLVEKWSDVHLGDTLASRRCKARSCATEFR